MQWITCLEGGPQRVNHAAVVVKDKIYSFGGYNSDENFEHDKRMDVHVFDTMLLRWRPVHCGTQKGMPKKCYGHTVVAHRNKIYLWGGRDNVSASNTLYCFDPALRFWQVKAVSGQIPEKADGHSACVINDYMYIFGGFEEESDTFSNAMHRLNLISFVWEAVKTQGEVPCSRDFHTASVIDDRMYIFGGRSFESEGEIEAYNNDISFLDTKTMKWEKPFCKGTPPSGRRSHSAVTYKNEIYIIGGFDGNTKYHLNDIHKFNPEMSSWSKMHTNGDPPCPRRRHCSCVVGDQLFLFGGSSPIDEDEYAQQYAYGVDDANHYLLLLKDHSDLYILDFFPSLKRLCLLNIIKYQLKTDFLPRSLLDELHVLTTNTKMLQSFYTDFPRTDYPGFGISA